MAVRGGANTVALIGFKSGSISFVVENVIEGVGNATPQPFQKSTASEVAVDNNQKILVSTTDDFSAALTLSDSHISTIESWNDNEAEVEICALTVDGTMYRCLSPFLINSIDVIDGIENGYVVSARRSGLDGYSNTTKGKLAVFTTVDLSKDYLWESNSGNNTPPGYSSTDISLTNTFTFTGDVLEVSLSEVATTPELYRDVFCPFVGRTVTVNITALNSDAGAEITSDNFECGLYALDVEGNVIATIDSDSYAASTASQTITLSGTIPSGTSDLRLYVLDVTASISGLNYIEFNQPTINITY